MYLYSEYVTVTCNQLKLSYDFVKSSLAAQQITPG